MSELVIEVVHDVDSLGALAIDARADNRVMVDRFIHEWRDGSNRFDLPGERAYVARLTGDVCGICGLNRDPFAGDASVARVRRMYVATAYRRVGVGTALIGRLLNDATGVFGWLHLRTHGPAAAAFYEAIGFERALAIPDCTHRRRLPA